MPYREHSMEPYHIIARINYKMNKEITYHSFFKNEYISKEYNRIDADNGNYNCAAMNQVCWPFESGYWSGILFTILLSPAIGIDTSNEDLSVFLQHTVFICQQKHLRIS